MPDSGDYLFDPDEFHEESDEPNVEADPSTIAFMDQQAAEFNAMESDFYNRYGFVHKCRCDQDYTEGNMVSVTECYAQMTSDALDACASLKAENTLLKNLIKAALGDALTVTEVSLDDEGSVRPDSEVLGGTPEA